MKSETIPCASLQNEFIAWFGQLLLADHVRIWYLESMQLVESIPHSNSLSASELNSQRDNDQDGHQDDNSTNQLSSQPESQQNIQIKSELRFPFFNNPYIRRMELQDDWVFSDEVARKSRGTWTQVIPNANNAVHVEIGTGNGFHFAEYAKIHSDVAFLGFEIKFKTLVQSIERARDFGAQRARMIKADARRLSDFFAPEEVEKVIVHFPDPWPKRRQQKNRLLNKAFFRELEIVLKSGGEFEFKTDHFGYFLFAARNAAESQLTMVHYTEDLHHSFVAEDNFVTAFEALFLKKGQRIFSFKLRRDF